MTNKNLKVAFQMDALEKLNFKGDSTYLFIMEAYNRGLEVYFYTPNTVSWVEEKVVARVCKINQVLDVNKVAEGEIPIKHNESELKNLEDFDIIFLRQDPPFDMAYITSTFLLEKIMDKVKIVNNPASVRNSPEKLLVTEFYKYMPKTIITSDYDTINQFLEENGRVVIKPLYGNAGSDVFFLQKGDVNVKPIIQYFLHTFKEQVMVQEFLENVKYGDKRIILIDGEFAGGFARIPAEGEIRSNLAVGGSAKESAITERDMEICKAIGSRLKELGLFFVGIDVIDGYMTEINVTSPTGVRSILNMSGEDLSVKLWDKLLASM
ncbi:MAG: glutathione synthase [Alphaproteobacteria bacterium]|jgi:glutathione synthase|nr:glutathione synthase [Alphaproteobacteria bacterium]